MKQPAAQAVHLADYAPPPWLVDEVHLVFRLSPQATRVLSRIRFRPNPATEDRTFRLDGDGPRLVRCAVDGAEAAPEVREAGLTLTPPDRPFLFEAEVEIDPEANTALSGLYMSNGMFCTQCEAQGFRRITFYPDRPDVMAPFTVRIESDLPVLLSNGNPGAAGKGFAEWHDPHPKPAYLFALVAGDLVPQRDTFVTSDGRAVDLAVWTRPGPDEGRCAFAIKSLKTAMRWDEAAYDLAYDLDVFNIVAVDDFNMGAMENKGLNVFNSSVVLASPATATDDQFAVIEAVVAHEYFHNWTGNRVTCRDWFQLCLKEGLTVFRDQQFSEDVRSAAVERIRQALAMRGQFREDAGPLAHPVRPESYVAVDNFYTATVYEKGAELVRMLKSIVGDEGYRDALRLYFARHDGQAVTIEDWLQVFRDATGTVPEHFGRWYSQAGTPRVTAEEEWEPKESGGGTYTLRLAQETPPTPGQPCKAPMPIPVRTGLLGADGSELVEERVLLLEEAAGEWTFDLPERPVPSLLRGFSAPVILRREADDAERAFLLANDPDPFARWEAGRRLATRLLCRMAGGARADDALPQALRALATDDAPDPAFRALCLALPSEDDVAQALHDDGAAPDPDAVHAAREALRLAVSKAMEDVLPGLRGAMRVTAPYRPDAEQSGRRALWGAALGYEALLDAAPAQAAYCEATNLTEEIAALSALLAAGHGAAEAEDFRERWSDERLVLDRWFSLQVRFAAPEKAAGTAEALARRPEFDLRNPNRFRAVFGALAGNHAGFHNASGAGYDTMADWLLKLDALNPQAAARMSTTFETWRRFDPDRQARAGAALDRILAAKDLSPDLREMAGRIRDA
ncbi:aminopeptidase N [Hasllibacter halocynthiae]|uniref:Aminopeptidase N n=1 Tax=Hasllibacter halocynthiae TaxID=595589 RepID=A0A2T0X9C8_9RHOB|nr:aminopeptidase N [Hasllibacter halocynthiae]PRY95552.1 aminopeptidase N [Hasllibacter halocynthiae]